MVNLFEDLVIKLHKLNYLNYNTTIYNIYIIYIYNRNHNNELILKNIVKKLHGILYSKYI